MARKKMEGKSDPVEKLRICIKGRTYFSGLAE